MQENSETTLNGLYKVSGDGRFGAAYVLEDGAAVLFERRGPLTDRDSASLGALSDLDDDAGLIANRDMVLLDRAERFLQKNGLL